ncbi:MAG: ComEA family DNA-binding protein [Chloroflexota bacterium]|nr:ComEA family DNA-binding protein [Chloroflexota bacterium]
MERIPPDWHAVDDRQDRSSVGAERAQPSGPAAGRLPLLAAVILACVALAVAAWYGTNGVSGREVLVEPTGPVPESSFPASTAGYVVVDVAGGVIRPGLYRLPENSRVGDAIAAAGGFGPSVDAAATSSTLNLAQKLADGTKVHIPERGEPWGAARSSPTGGAMSANPGSTGGKLDLNSATQAELEALPGIGPVTAAKIIAARQLAPFRTVDELRERKVVGPATLDKIRHLVSVGG